MMRRQGIPGNLRQFNPQDTPQRFRVNPRSGEPIGNLPNQSKPLTAQLLDARHRMEYGVERRNRLIILKIKQQRLIAALSRIRLNLSRGGIRIAIFMRQ
ncbi:hypothetical protein U14_02382 [Candidatus Moduliflexus flocculans]|uniref:Uncharacterized protein n=1 Tax=Candidatus Moduliflexus flocculans TaxID=1499966 RepID=A0A0S6VXS6_9BACT|nr:hypothetical protein U14_02382 [Candidatus Moduliflexus flocculans]